MLRTDGIAKFSDAWAAQPLFATQTRAEQKLLDERRSYRRGQDPEGLARSLGAMGLAEMPDYRSAVDDRVRLIVGGDDQKYLAIAKGLPAPLTVIDGSGHDPTLEQPEKLRDAIAAIKW
jgi:pimeloyl-ACP methyl ester carboxylesterase